MTTGGETSYEGLRGAKPHPRTRRDYSYIQILEETTRGGQTPKVTCKKIIYKIRLGKPQKKVLFLVARPL